MVLDVQDIIVLVFIHGLVLILIGYANKLYTRDNIYPYASIVHRIQNIHQNKQINFNNLNMSYSIYALFYVLFNFQLIQKQNSDKQTGVLC